MGMPNKDLFVTLADRNYLEQAKQLFSGLYFNAGWSGDCMLLAHDVPEPDLAWFRKRGILVRHCAPLFEGPQGGMSAVLTSKFYLFTPEFKQWRTVIYSDADAIVRASLDALCGLQGFHSVRDVAKKQLKFELVSKGKIKERLLDAGECRKRIQDIKNEYDLKKAFFCAGFFVFSSDVIEDENVFQGFCQMFRRCAMISQHGDQLAFNLYFYDRWGSLPVVYNVQVMGDLNPWLIPPQDVSGMIIHFVTADKPWINRGYFYAEWKNNLDRADSLNFNRNLERKAVVWHPEAIAEVEILLEEIMNSKLKRARLAIDWLFGRLGRVFRMANTDLYNKLIKHKKQMNIDRKVGMGLYIAPEESMIIKLRRINPWK